MAKNSPVWRRTRHSMHSSVLLFNIFNTRFARAGNMGDVLVQLREVVGVLCAYAVELAE